MTALDGIAAKDLDQNRVFQPENVDEFEQVAAKRGELPAAWRLGITEACRPETPKRRRQNA